MSVSLRSPIGEIVQSANVGPPPAPPWMAARLVPASCEAVPARGRIALRMTVSNRGVRALVRGRTRGRPNQNTRAAGPAGAVRRIAFRQISVSAKRVKRYSAASKARVLTPISARHGHAVDRLRPRRRPHFIRRTRSTTSHRSTRGYGAGRAFSARWRSELAANSEARHYETNCESGELDAFNGSTRS